MRRSPYGFELSENRAGSQRWSADDSCDADRDAADCEPARTLRIVTLALGLLLGLAWSGSVFAQAGTLQLNPVSYTGNEDGPAVTVIVERVGGSAGPASIDYQTMNVTASDFDHQVTSGTLSWADGETGARTLTVLLYPDGLVEGDETFQVSFSNAIGALFPPPWDATVTIQDGANTNVLVTNLNDGGAGSLRAAVTLANLTDVHTITFAQGLTGVITLFSGELVISQDLDIQGPGSAVISVSGDSTSRVFSISDKDWATTIDVAINGLTITEGQADTGGGLRNEAETLTLDGVVITANHATQAGGGLWIGGWPTAGQATSSTIRNCEITGNAAPSGGGIHLEYIEAPGLLIEDTTIAFNTASRNGGGIHIDQVEVGGAVTIENTEISTNSAVLAGGGVFLDHIDGTVAIQDAGISTNSARNGGGVGTTEDVGGVVTIMNATVTGNHADEDGGGLNCVNPGIQGSTISANTARANGGGIRGSGLLVQNTRLIDNLAGFADEGSGGGFYGGATVFEDCVISGNTANGQPGGGIYAEASSGVELRKSTVSGNTATKGGGLFLEDPGGASSIENCTISENRATAGAGGGIYLRSSSAESPDLPDMIAHTTVSGNRSTASGGGMFVSNLNLTLRNAVVADNLAGDPPLPDDLANDEEWGGEFRLFYTLVETPGIASITDLGGSLLNQDPRLGVLRDNGGSTLTHLPGLFSPVVDAGDPAFAAPPGPAVDQRGLARVFAARIDMGAVETAGGLVDILRFVAATTTVAEDDGQVAITVERVGGGVGPASVQYATSDGTALGGSDYTTTTDVLSWADGETGPKTFQVVVHSDVEVEPTESIHLVLSNAVGAALGVPSTAVVRLADSLKGVRFSAATYMVSESQGSVTITVERIGSANGAASVQYQTSDGTALEPDDYQAVTGTLDWADGELGPRTFAVTVIAEDPSDPEGPETINLVLLNPVGVGLAAPFAAVINLRDADDVVRFSSANYTVNEDDGSVTVTVERLSDGDMAVVSYATSDGTATSPADYQVTSGTLFLMGSGDYVFQVPVKADFLIEPDETINLTLSNALGVGLGVPSTATITLQDGTDVTDPDQMRFTAAAYDADENETITIAVERVGTGAGALSVHYETTNGTASAPDDYIVSEGMLTWDDGDVAAKTFDVLVKADIFEEPVETVNLILSDPVGGILGNPSTAVLSIQERTSAVRFSAESYEANEDDGLVTITVERIGAFGPASVTYFVGDFFGTGCTASSPADYQACFGALNWASGDAAPKTFQVQVRSDTVVEGVETIALSLQNPSGAVLMGPAQATIELHDGANQAAAVEGIPTLTDWGVLALAALLAASALLAVRRLWQT